MGAEPGMAGGCSPFTRTGGVCAEVMLLLVIYVFNRVIVVLVLYHFQPFFSTIRLKIPEGNFDLSLTGTQTQYRPCLRLVKVWTG